MWTIGSILTLTLIIQIPFGTMSGRVINEKNSAVVGITVQLLRKVYEPGLARLQVVRTTSTNSQGEYRFDSLAEAQYYVRTGSLVPATSDNQNTNPPYKQGYPSTYYPATTNEISAVPVEVTADSRIQNVDIVTSLARLVNIRGRVTDGIRLRQPYLCWVFLVSAQDQDAPVGNRKLRCDTDATFEFRDVIPGRYYLIARRIDDAADRADAVEFLDVRDGDIDNVDLVSTLGSPILGRVRADGARAPELQIVFRPVDALKVISTRRATSNPRGTFMVPTLPVGTYRLSVSGVPPGYYVKSAMLDRSDVFSEGLSIQGKITSELVISLSSTGGQISGTVLDTAQQKVSGSVVMLVPATNDRADAYQVTWADSTGKYTLTGISPGDYYLYAWDRLIQSEYYNPEFLLRFSGLGHRIQIREGDRLRLDLRRILANR